MTDFPSPYVRGSGKFDEDRRFPFLVVRHDPVG